MPAAGFGAKKTTLGKSAGFGVGLCVGVPLHAGHKRGCVACGFPRAFQRRAWHLVWLKIAHAAARLLLVTLFDDTSVLPCHIHCLIGCSPIALLSAWLLADVAMLRMLQAASMHANPEFFFAKTPPPDHSLSLSGLLDFPKNSAEE